MADIKKVPAIRFKLFRDEWDESKLGFLADIVRGASPRPIDNPKWFDENSEIGWLRISDVTEQQGRIHFLEQRISKAGEEKTRVLTEPHLLLSIAASVGKPVVNYVKTGVHDGFLIFKNPLFIQEFMFQWLRMFEEQWKKYGQPGSQVNLNSEIVKSQAIFFPKNEEEQTRISSYFQNLEKLISLHQAKVNKLVNLKNAMLEKMFPKDGADVPEIRLKGFQDVWMKFELKDLCTLITKQTGFDYSSTIKPSLIRENSRDTYCFIQNKDFEGTKINFNTDFYIPKTIAEVFPNIVIDRPSILISISGKIGNAGFYSSPNKAFIGGAVGICKLINKSDGLIVLYNLLGHTGQNYFQSLTKASSHANITVADIRKINIYLPNSDEEKITIGSYFSKIDDYISLNQKQLDKLNNLKKACLEQMFV